MPIVTPCRKAFDPDALDAPLAALDELPRTLWLPGIVNSVGDLPRRLDGARLLQRTLLTGMLPAQRDWIWPTAAVRAPFFEIIDALDLARYCAGNADVTEQVLRSLLWHTDRIVDYRDDCRDDHEGHERADADAIDRAAQAFAEDWRQRTGAIDELRYVFGGLGDALKSARWDLTRGVLNSEGWQEMLRIRRSLEALPALSVLIRRLGRLYPTDEPEACRQLPAPRMAQALRQVVHAREARVPNMPGDTRGVERSGNVARMLAAEAVLLRHPKLRLIWFARHAERILLAYQDSAALPRDVLTERQARRQARPPRPARRLELGPLIVCVDTSGSMQGAAEQIAKALVLESMRSAMGQQRPCYVYAFSGPGEIVECELSLDGDGIAAAVAFLSQAFHGGTDVSEPLERALRRIGEARWQCADLLIASDGEFGAVPSVAARVRRARAEQGLRVQGVLIGDRETIGLLELCDDIFWIKDWRRFGNGAESPVHTKSLTAMYFPNALRQPGTD